MAEIKIMNLNAMQHYDEKIKQYITDADEKVLADSKQYFEDNADRFDGAGVAATKVKELADGAVKDNTDAIAKLNGDASTEGSVAKAVADAKALVDADVDAVEKKANDNADEITGLKTRMDDAEADIQAINEDIGDVDTLPTTAKKIVDAIIEVRNAVSAGGTEAQVTLDATTTTEGMAKSYTIKQGNNVVGTIDIPKDMVVKSGDVVTLAEGDVEGYAAGTYIKLTLANATNDVIYVNVGTLVDIYKAEENATQIQLTIDSATRVISAVIKAESVTANELAANAVTTVKIADGNVTKTKLSTAVQASLDKADASASQTALNEEVTRAKAAEEKALTDAKAYADEQIGVEKNRAEGVESGLDNRLKNVEAQLGTGEGSVDDKIATAKQEAIDAAAGDATTKANAAESNANTYTDGKVATNKGLIDANADAIEALEAKVGDGFVEITTEEIDAMFAAE